MEQDLDNEVEPTPRRKRAATAAGTVEVATHTAQPPRRTSKPVKTPKRKQPGLDAPPRRRSTRIGEFLISCVVIIT